MVKKHHSTDKMKTLLLARPDHSINLFNYLSQENDLSVQFHTFGVFKKNSLLSKWKPYVKTVDPSVNISYQFTVFHKLLFFLQKHFPFDYYKTENHISEYFYRQIIRKSVKDLDLIHYWPVYSYKAIQTFKKSNPQTKLLADVYAAHPVYAQKVLEPEFDKYGISFKKSHFSKSSERDILSLENVENIVVPSEYLAEIYRQYLPKTNIFTASFGLLNYGKNINTNQEIRVNRKPLRMVFVGKISIEKGCIYLLEAMKKLPANEFQLDMIGDVELSQTDIFQKYTQLPNIYFLGKLPNQKVLSHIAQYHVFVMPSLTDAYSLAVSEALSSKIPVIVTENVGNKEDIKKFQVGEICKVKSVESLLQTILKFQNEEYRQFLKSNIENFIDEDKKYDYASRVFSIYQNLISNE